ncbi:MAG: hypothetical protein A2017_05935 [Lentisphaerae bacterium GWF2_44_16]|nr:MAG: hypothetical protein A2017_05935 [Lentisphaerae bacterium GWF2_44_16]
MISSNNKCDDMDRLQMLFEVPDDTNPIFKQCLLNEIYGNITPIYIYRLEDDKCFDCSFGIEKNTIKIGTDPVEADIILDHEPGMSKIQLVIKFISKQWFIIECGETCMMLVNGIKKRQTNLKPENSCVLKVGKTSFVLSTNTPEHKIDMNTSSRKFKVEAGAESIDYPFSKTVLIGSNPICDICTEGDDFMGLISSFGNSLYFYSPADGQFYTEGKSAERPVPLSLENNFVLGATQLKLYAPEDAKKIPGAFSLLPDYSASHLVLMQLTEEGEIGKKLILPGKGHSIFLGRDKENYLSIENSKISRKHVQIIMYGNSIVLVDCESTNGTFVNGDKIIKKLVYPGDLIMFGDCKYVLAYSE